MLSEAVLSFLLAAQSPSATIVQKTSGWCSPAIANVKGNVTVTCIGVDPRALKRLNEELNRKNLQLADKMREADEWTKKYKQLEARLQATDDSALSRKAEEYLHQGDLQSAGAVLDQALAIEETEIDRAAANHYNRGLVFELQFLPLQALPHIEKAYQYRPRELIYGEEFAYLLIKQNDFSRAEPVLLATVANAREMALKSEQYKADVAILLNYEGVLYQSTQRTKEAEAVFQEALKTRAELSQGTPLEYEPDIAGTLVNLATLYRDTQRITDAETTYKRALEIYRELATSDPSTYDTYVATTLSNLGIIYRAAQQMREAENSFDEGLRIERRLVKSNRGYLPDLAAILNNLGTLYRATQRMKDAATAYNEALQIRQELATTNPAAYEPELAQTLNNLGNRLPTRKVLPMCRTAASPVWAGTATCYCSARNGTFSIRLSHF